jgi:hypothetical protein
MDFTISDSTDAPVIERDILPAGTHELVVKHCEEGPNPYKQSDENPDGICLKLRLSDPEGRFKFVFDDIPRHLGWRAQQLAAAVSIKPVGDRLSLTPDELIDQAVTVEISHYTSKAGKTSAVVKKYLPRSDAAKPARKPVARTQAAKVTAALEDDDIPF